MKFYISIFLIFTSMLIYGKDDLPIMLKISSKNFKISQNIQSLIRSNIESLLTRKGYSLIDIKIQQEALKEQSKKIKDECIDDACLIDTGKMLAAKELFLVEIVQIKNIYTFKIKNIDLETGRLQNTNSTLYDGKLDNIKKLNNFTINININIINQIKKRKEILKKCNSKMECYNLGIKYQYLRAEDANNYFLKSCKLNFIDGCRKVVNFYSLQSKNKKKAKEYIDKVISLSDKSCIEGNRKDCAKLGYFYLMGMDSAGGIFKPIEVTSFYKIKIDKKKAKKYYKRAISLKLKNQNLLLMYLLDLEKNRDYYGLLYACQNDIGLACNYAASMAPKIEGVDKKMNQVLLRKACNLGYKHSCKFVREEINISQNEDDPEDEQSEDDPEDE